MLQPMFAHRAPSVVCLFVFGLLLAGCGFRGYVFDPAPVASTPAEKLQGNWLIYGSMPRVDVPLAGPNQTQGLTISFSSVGNTLTGSAFLSGTCASGETFGVIFGNALTAVPDPSGHFVTSSTQTYDWGFTLTGMAPNLSGEPWSGTYQLTNTGANSTCAFSGSGAFTATPVSELTGTFSGSGEVLSFVGPGAGASPGSLLSVGATLVQGATQTQGTPTTYSAQLVEGQIQIAGIPCVMHASTTGAQDSFLLGNLFNLDFSMDDGSTIFLQGTIDNASTTRLLLTTVSVAGGNCSGNYEIVEPGGTLSR